jgi:Methyl-accepting chemotaxis protein
MLGSEKRCKMIKYRKIGKKLIAYFFLIAVISGAGSVVGLGVMNNIVSSYRYALNNYGFSQGNIGKFNSEFNNSCAIIRDMIIETSQQDKLKSADELKKSNEKINEYFANIKPTLVNAEEMKCYDNIKENLSNNQDLNNQVVTLAIQNRNDDAHKMLIEQGVTLSNSIKSSVDSLLSMKTTTGNQLSANLNQQSAVSTVVMICIILASFTMSLLIAMKISRGISKPVTEMAKAAQRLAEGDLSVQINVHSKDEIGQLGAAFSDTISILRAYMADITSCLAKIANSDLTASTTQNFKGDFIALKDSIDGIVLSLNDVIFQISQSAEQVSSGSNQVSDSAQILSQGASEQASSIEELSVTISEISENVKQNAANAMEASFSVSHVSSELEASNLHMQEMLAAMSQISNSSKEIGKIINTIEEIAFQTNILALNAAVEAARAGQAGKGFAVVADEVRRLAGRSAEAAKSTTILIKNSAIEVGKGTKIAEATEASLVKVVNDAKAVANAVSQIAQTSTQQASSISQVTLGVNQISTVVQANSATSEESAAESERLSEQANILKSLVNKFNLQSQAALENIGCLD